MAQEKNQRSRGRGESKMNSAIHDVVSLVVSAYCVPDFSNARRRNFLRHAGEAVHAAYFLHGGRRNCEELPANAKQNYLFRTRSASLAGSNRLHQRTPTGVARLNARTRFSIAE